MYGIQAARSVEKKCASAAPLQYPLIFSRRCFEEVGKMKNILKMKLKHPSTMMRGRKPDRFIVLCYLH